MSWKHVTGGADTEEQRKAKIAALLREQYYATVQGDKTTLGLIEVELRRLGHEAEKPSDRAERRPAARRSEKR